MKQFKIIVMLLLAVSYLNAQSVKLPALFSDHMVLQQNSDAPIWGKAKANANITINCSWKLKKSVQADAQGFWKTTIKTPTAGGPYQIIVSDSTSKITINDVLIGEVWICSGQSNMEMPLGGWPPKDTIFTAKKEISTANNPKLRMFTVKKAFSLTPVDTCTGSWQLCNPHNVGDFSATGYFFGKKLFNELQIPIGLIHTSWGGTPVESWTDPATLALFPEFNEYLLKIKDADKEYNALVHWISSHPQVKIEGTNEEKWKKIELNDIQCIHPNFHDEKWQNVKVPNLWETTGMGDFDGIIWFRKKVEIPTEWINKDLEISLAMIDDMDATYVNGEKIGGYEEPGYWQQLRKYNIPASIVKDKILTIAIRIIDTQGGGGIWGDSSQMYIKPINMNAQALSLAGTWKFLPVAEFMGNYLYAYSVDNADYFSRPKLSISLNAYQPMVLYNAMILPIVPYAIKGAIWYQGEANVGKATQYEKLFPAMITGWRKIWNIGDFPFYYVQIAPWKYSSPDNYESGWLREAQRRSMNLKNTGMVVTLDIGNVENIHPGNKKDVGERLALWALSKDYSKKIEYSGPLFQKMEIKDGKAIITFTNASNGLLLKEDNKNEFEIAGKDGKFVPANAKVNGGQLIIWSESITEPVNVRYAFKNGSHAVLFNKEGLPASCFTTENMQQ